MNISTSTHPSFLCWGLDFLGVLAAWWESGEQEFQVANSLEDAASTNTVDGSEILRSPVEVGSLPCFAGFYRYQVVQEFFHVPFDKFLHEDFDMKARVLFRQFGGQTFKISFQVLTQLLLMVQKSCPVFFANIPVFIGLDTSQVVFSPEFSDQQVILKINSCLTSSSKVQGSSRVFTLEIFT